jgi:hypothetical protein
MNEISVKLENAIETVVDDGCNGKHVGDPDGPNAHIVVEWAAVAQRRAGDGCCANTLELAEGWSTSCECSPYCMSCR